MIYRALLVDDEKSARDRLCSLLQNHSSMIDVSGEAEDGRDALRKIKDLRPDIIFLDINLPFLNGFEIADNLDYEPQIVFVTAFDSFALKAFEYAAVDYLVKPVEPDRLARTVERLCRDGSGKFSGEKMKKVFAGLKQRSITRIQVRTGNEIRFIPVEEILRCEAEDYYSVLYTEKEKHLVRISLYELERTLPQERFIRIHRKYIINLSCVQKLKTRVGSGAFVCLDRKGLIQLPVSRSYVSGVRERLKEFAGV